jgi:hypothetical protein
MKKIYIWLLMAIMIAGAGEGFSQSNQYLHFDRVDDFAILEGGGQYVVNKTAMSITGWFYCDELAYGQGMMGFRDGSSGFYLIILNDGVIECRLAGTGGMCEFVTPPFTVVPEVWQHFAWVYDGTSVKLYVNGILAGSAPASGTLTNADMPFAIGKSPLGAGFNFVFGGRIDEVSAWNKGLSASEVQDIVDNEITGTPDGLMLYYKFNQGVPGGNNTTITKLISETGGSDRDADLMNFAMEGDISNFGGDLNPGFQAITFPQIPNHLTLDAPFQISAEASSGLEVFFTIVSGPATIQGNTITLDGTEGEVVVKASQPGNEVYEPAADLFNTFQVINPYTYAPELDLRSPLQGDVFVPDLDMIPLATYSMIDNQHLFSIQSVEFVINGETIEPINWFNGYYTAYWQPPAFGSYEVSVVSTNNYGAANTKTAQINVTENVTDQDMTAFSDVWIYTSIPEAIVEAELPSYQGAFDQITGTLELACPAGGCGEWDRIARVEALGPNGKWIEIIRYITPYGKACSHSIDLTDYRWLLQGKTKFRIKCVTFDNGYLWNLSLYYHTGTPDHKYSAVSPVWHQEYPFGDLGDLQPVEPYSFSFPADVSASTLKLVGTGHAWGDNNTGNAAEFHEDTHHIWVNGTEAFEQHNWQICNPNPDGCQPQNGTWFHNRAGWCPGSIAPWFDYNMTPYLSQPNVELTYIFDEDYVDYCHPNNPNCITGTTCPDCNDGYNPFLDVACNLVIFSESPIEAGLYTSIPQAPQAETITTIYPNPTHGVVHLDVKGSAYEQGSIIWIYNSSGNLMEYQRWDGTNTAVDLSAYTSGLYVLVIQTNKGLQVEKITVQ